MRITAQQLLISISIFPYVILLLNDFDKPFIIRNTNCTI